MNDEKDPIEIFLKMQIKGMFAEIIVLIAVILVIAIISAFITCITGIKL